MARYGSNDPKSNIKHAFQLYKCVLKWKTSKTESTLVQKLRLWKWCMNVNGVGCEKKNTLIAKLGIPGTH